MAYQAMRDIMMTYAEDYALTDSVLQEAQDSAKIELFRLADDNICYGRGGLLINYANWTTKLS